MDWRRPMRRFVPDWMRRVEYLGRRTKLVWKTERDLFGYFTPWSAARVFASLIRQRPVKVPRLPAWLPFDSAVGYHLRESTEKLRRLASYVESNDLVFDVGAHAGLFSVLAAQRGGRVVAIEPDPDVAGLLRANTRRFDVEVLEAAVAEESGVVTLWRNQTSTQASSLIRTAAETFGDVEPMEVPAVTLNDLIDSYGTPDVVKMDIQGLESRVLPTMPLEALSILLVEVSDLDQNPRLRDDLTKRLGEPEVVNIVSGGADLAFRMGR